MKMDLAQQQAIVSLPLLKYLAEARDWMLEVSLHPADWFNLMPAWDTGNKRYDDVEHNSFVLNFHDGTMVVVNRDPEVPAGSIRVENDE
jgi:hypothetical protein